MYTPPYNRNEDHADVLAFMRANGFVLLVTAPGGEIAGSHLPCVIEERGEQLVIDMHMAKSNPQWEGFFEDEVMLMFWGPHAYVSPRWYGRAPAVPTWNYAAVHAYGTVRVMAEAKEKHASQRRLVAAYDPQWLPEFDALPAQYLEGMLANIVNFEITVTRLEARWKLSQNRGRDEQERIIANLEASALAGDRELAQLSKQYLVDK